MTFIFVRSFRGVAVVSLRHRKVYDCTARFTGHRISTFKPHFIMRSSWCRAFSGRKCWCYNRVDEYANRRTHFILCSRPRPAHTQDNLENCARSSDYGRIGATDTSIVLRVVFPITKRNDIILIWSSQRAIKMRRSSTDFASQTSLFILFIAPQAFLLDVFSASAE